MSSHSRCSFLALSRVLHREIGPATSDYPVLIWLGFNAVFLVSSPTVIVQQFRGVTQIYRAPRCHCPSCWMSVRRPLSEVASDPCSGSGRRLWASGVDSDSDAVHPVRLAGGSPAPGWGTGLQTSPPASGKVDCERRSERKEKGREGTQRGFWVKTRLTRLRENTRKQSGSVRRRVERRQVEMASERSCFLPFWDQMTARLSRWYTPLFP